MSDNPDFQRDINLDEQSVDELVVNTARVGANEITPRRIVRTQTVPRSGGTEKVTLQPPAGTIRQVVSINFFVLAPASSSTVTHEFKAEVSPSDVAVVRYTSEADDPIQVSHNVSGTVTRTSFPSGTRAKQEAVKVLQATNDDPVTFSYINRSAQDQTDDREYTILIRETKV
jgi:hypothetical protein